MRPVALLLLPLFLFAALIVQKLASPDDLDVLDQAKMATYVTDIFHHGNWLVPMERGERPTTKPPLQPWIATIASLPLGRPREIALRAPSILAAAGVLLLTLSLGRRLGGPEAGAIAAVSLVANFLFVKLATLARPDMLHCFFTTLSLYCAALALEREEAAAASPEKAPSPRSLWLGAFAALGGACLAKSPVSLLLVPLTVIAWALLSGNAGARLRRIPWLAGLALAAAIAAAWFVPALLTSERLLETFRSELLTHAAGDEAGGMRKPALYLIPHFFQKFLPWSIFLVVGLLAAARRRFWDEALPSQPNLPDERGQGLPLSSVRFFACAVAATTIVFSMASQKRSDYVLPAWPPAALVVAHLLAKGRGTRTAFYGAVLLAVVSGAAAAALLDPDLLGLFVPKPYLEVLLAHRTALAALLAVAACAAGLAAASARAPLRLAAGLALATSIVLGVNFAWLSRHATELRGGAIRELCARVEARGEPFVVGAVHLGDGAWDVSDSLLFYLDWPGAPLGAIDAARRVVEGKARYVLLGNIARAEVEKAGIRLAVADETRPPYVYDYPEAYFLLEAAR